MKTQKVDRLPENRFYYIESRTYIYHGLWNSSNSFIGYRYRGKWKGFWLDGLNKLNDDEIIDDFI